MKYYNYLGLQEPVPSSIFGRVTLMFVSDQSVLELCLWVIYGIPDVGKILVGCRECKSVFISTIYNAI